MVAALDQRWGTSDQIALIPAMTDVERQAKASVASVLLDEWGNLETSQTILFARNVLRDIAGAGIVGEVYQTDTELIALCDQFDALTRERSGLFEGETRIEDDDARDAPLDALNARSRPLVERICATRAARAEGIRAKARSLRAV